MAASVGRRKGHSKSSLNVEKLLVTQEGCSGAGSAEGRAEGAAVWFASEGLVK